MPVLNKNTAFSSNWHHTSALLAEIGLSHKILQQFQTASHAVVWRCVHVCVLECNHCESVSKLNFFLSYFSVFLILHKGQVDLKRERERNDMILSFNIPLPNYRILNTELLLTELEEGPSIRSIKTTVPFKEIVTKLIHLQ